MNAIAQLLSQLAGVAAFITAVVTALVMWRKSRQENRKLGAEAGKTDAEGQAVLSGQALEWSRDFRQEAKDAKQEAKDAKAAASAAEQSAREANLRADQCSRDRANDREVMADLRRDHDALQTSYNRLLEQIGRCSAGSFCPLADSLTR